MMRKICHFKEIAAAAAKLGLTIISGLYTGLVYQCSNYFIDKTQQECLKGTKDFTPWT
jgi:hypothetical protein